MEDSQHREGARRTLYEFRTRQWLDPTWRYAKMLEMTGDEMTWDCKNESAVGMTISRDALEAIDGQMRTWLGSRIMRRMNEGKTAKHPVVTLTVVFED